MEKRFGGLIHRVINEQILCFVMVISLLGLAGCSNEPGDSGATGEFVLAADIRQQAQLNQLLSINEIKWQADGRLRAKGNASSGQLVTLSDPTTTQVIGTALTNTEGQWQLEVTQLNIVPCSIHVSSDNLSQTVAVQNAPSNCTASSVQNTPTALSLSITVAKWKPDNNTLKVKGEGASARQMVHIFDAQSGQLLGSDRANVVGVWKVKMHNLLVLPCVVTAIADDHIAQAPVLDVPANCGTGVVSQPNLPSPTIPSNQAPDSVISSPAADMTIQMGTAVRFLGSGYDSDKNTPLSYLWQFNGAAFDSSQRNPGTIVFNQPGIYPVMLTVFDSFGIADPTPAVRMIVVENTTPTEVRAPNGQIITPTTDMTISVGQTVNFSAMSPDPGNNLPLTYVWDFGGGAANSTVQNPGNVLFAIPGVYMVALAVADSLGNMDNTPDIRVITVLSSNPIGGSNLAPNGDIVEPASAVVVSVGQSLNFRGLASDPDNDVPLFHFWDFGGGANNSSLATPGNVAFSQPGQYFVTYVVTDSLGLADPTPATRMITVQNSRAPGSGNGSVISVAPESTIQLPTTDQTITVGQSVVFTGFGVDPDNNTPLIYRWDFDGVSPNTMMQNPGEIIFRQKGTYRVKLSVIDSLGQADATPAIRVIHVSDSADSNQPPSGSILSPATEQMTINVGETVNFFGSGVDPENNLPLSFHWDFGGAAANSALMNPGSITLTRAGNYNVTLIVKDSLGLAASIPVTRTIVVQNLANIESPPESYILSPVTDMVINVGDRMAFRGAGASNSTNQSLIYQWDFGEGAVPRFSSLESPGLVQFNVPGRFEVLLTLQNASAASDPTPEVRVITVRDTNTGLQSPKGQIDLPVEPTTTISVGQSVGFRASATDSVEHLPLTYYWDFDGATPDFIGQNPGLVVFDKSGTYRIRLQVSNNRFMEDPRPAERTVVVLSPNSGSSVAPTGTVLTPNDNNLTVSIGEVLNFTSSATDIDNNLPISYRWNFDGLLPASNVQNPGAVLFNKVGEYAIRLLVTDAAGVSDATPEMRIIRVVSAAETSPGVGNAPNGMIISPSQNSSISVGGTINFQSVGTDPDNQLPLTYRWMFEGTSISTSNIQNPGPLQFDRAGTYRATLIVSDSSGSVDPMPDERIITVGSGGGTGNNGARPVARIIMPATDLTINAGEKVHFMGETTDPNAGRNVTYQWDFAGAASRSAEQNSGDITFNIPGIYKVTLSVTNSTNPSDLTPAQRIITVLGNDNGSANNAPNGTIVLPVSNVTVRVGQSVNFSGFGEDSDNNTPLSYHWDFGLASTSHSSLQNPGNIQFNQTGQFMVTFTVTDSLNKGDPIADVRVVTVTN